MNGKHAKTQRQRPLAAVADEPMAILQRAFDELKKASDMLDVRQAAEKAHLAMSSALEVATRKPIKSFSEELRRVDQVSRWLKDPALKKQHHELRQVLHGKCFHAAECPAAPELFRTIGLAEGWVDRVLRSGRRRKGER